MSMEYEFISHRSNVGFLGTGNGEGKKFLDLHNDRLSVYAERCYSLGKYGGDAYPVVWEKESGGKKYGLVLAADGVGQASYEHPSLKQNLDAELKKEFGGIFDETNESERKKLRLFVFLKELLGIDMLEAKDGASREELDYAMRSFSDIPVAGFFGGRTTDENGNGVEDQSYMPFYDRQSQAIGSRLTCVCIFKEFRAYALDKQLTKWTEKDADELRKAISESLYGEGEDSLVSKTRKYFSYDDTIKADRKNFYYLPSTVAAWFYIVDGNNISAVALNCGDARCYKVDLQDGVKQISDDDIAADGDTMSAFVHYGQVARCAASGHNGYYDNTFRAAIVELKAPCALFACSDGVYDTCPEEWTPSGRILGNPNADCSDVLFEYRMLKAFRRTYSLDDLSEEIVYSFYGQNAPHDLTKKTRFELNKAGAGMNVKKDDSGTFSAKFFSTAGDPFEIFDSLREKNDTTLDKLIAFAEKYDIPVKDLHWQAPTALGEEDFADMAKDWVRNPDFVEFLVQIFQKDDMSARKARGEEIYFGARVQKYNPSLPQSMFFKSNAVGIIKYMLSPECKDNEKVQELLEKYEVAKAYQEASVPKIDYTIEKLRQKFETLTEAFYGDIGKRENRNDIIVDKGRAVDDFEATLDAKMQALDNMKADEDVKKAVEAAKQAAGSAKKAAEKANDIKVGAQSAIEAKQPAQDIAQLAQEAQKAASEATAASVQAGKAFDAAKKAAEAITDPQAAQSALTDAQNAADKAKRFAEEASQVAAEVQNAADAVKAREDEYKAKLDRAANNVEALKNAAESAKAKAEAARDRATAAKQKAESADDPNDILTYANQAQTAAEEAQNAATAAKEAADEAQKEADAVTETQAAAFAVLNAAEAAQNAADQAKQQAEFAQDALNFAGKMNARMRSSDDGENGDGEPRAPRSAVPATLEHIVATPSGAGADREERPSGGTVPHAGPSATAAVKNTLDKKKD